MPPHCDSLDGPVVTAAARALQTANVELVLPYVHADGEAEVHQAFARVLPLRAGGDGMGEPAGLDPGPVLPLAEQAVANGDVQPVYELLAAELRHQLAGRLGRVGELAA